MHLQRPAIVPDPQQADQTGGDRARGLQSRVRGRRGYTGETEGIVGVCRWLLSGWVVLSVALLALPVAAEMRFEGPIQWQDWEPGVKQAAAKKKPVLLLLYTDSCPKCTLTGHLFRDNKELQKLAKGFVMVHVNSGTAPMSIVGRFQRYGNYAPRIVFLRPDASAAEDIQSGNTQFPYYYQPSRPELLVTAMQKAAHLGRSAGSTKPPGKSRQGQVALQGSVIARR